MNIKQQIVEYFIEEAETLCDCTAPKIAFIKSYNTLHDYDKAIERIVGLTNIEDESINYSAILGETITRIVLEQVSSSLNNPREELRNVIRFHSLEIVQDLIWFIIEIDSPKAEVVNISGVIDIEELKSEVSLNHKIESLKHNILNAVAYSVEV